MARKIKILFVGNIMNLGGVEKSMLSLIKSLPEEKFDIHLALQQLGHPLDDEIPSYVKVGVISQLEKHHANINHPERVLLGLLRKGEFAQSMKLFFKLAQGAIHNTPLPFYDFMLGQGKLPDEEYDIAIAYNGPSELIEWYVTQYVNAKRKFAWLHFDVTDAFTRKSTVAKTHPHFEKIFCVSQRAKVNFDAKYSEYSEKTCVFNNLVDFADISTLAMAFEPWKSGGDDVHIVTVGRIEEVKGQDLAIRAASLLKQNGYKFKWHLVGTGSKVEEWKALAITLGVEQEIVFEGLHKNPYPYMRAADVYVQTSRFEGFCITIKEACCFTAPIVSTDFVGSEQIEGREYSSVVEKDPQAIADAILSLPKGAKAEARVPQSQDKQVADLVSLFSSVTF